MVNTHGRVNEPYGLLADSETSIVDGVQDGCEHGRRCGGSEYTLEFPINGDNIVSTVERSAIGSIEVV